MITVKDLKSVLLETHNNPLSRSIRIHVQAEYGFHKYQLDRDVELEVFEANLKELTQIQDEMLEEIVKEINNLLESNDV